MKEARSSLRKRIYLRIARSGVVSKAELLEEFDVTSSSLTRLLEDMTGSGLVAESGFGDSTGGRRPILYAANPTYGWLLGLEISRLRSSLGLFDMAMNPLAFTHWKMDERMTPERLVEHVADYAKQFLAERGIAADKVLGIGVGAVGPLDPERGLILKPRYFPAEGWNDVAIVRLLEERLGFPAWLENGANTALIGEHWACREQDVRHMLYVHAGVGLRSAMMSGGRIVRGAVDPEGSIGQMVIQADGPRLGEEGNFGALEAFVSAQALERHTRAQLKMGRDSVLSGLPPEGVGFERIAAAAAQGDALAKEQFTRMAVYLGIGLANLINILHPESIIVGGPLVGASDDFYETAIGVARKNTYYYPQYKPVFSKGLLLEDAVATGAAVMVMREVEL